MSTIDVKVPDIGDFKNVAIIEINVKVGDVIKADEPLITLESDKAAMEVPAPQAGKVEAILVKIGDKVSEGTAIIKLAGADAPAASAPAPKAAAAPAGVSAPAPAAAAPAAGPAAKPVSNVPSAGFPLPVDFGNVHASPAVRRLARELEIDLTKVAATGEGGRVTKEDVRNHLGRGGGGAAVSGGMGIPEIPAVDFSKFGPIEVKPLSRIKKLSGPHLHRSWLNIPHVTHNDEADITDVEAFRRSLDDEGKADKKKPYRVSLLPFLMKASVSALKAFPTLNSSLSPAKDALIEKRYWNVGIAVDTPDGLVVPVIRDADRKGIIEISRELGEISQKARDGKLTAADMSGATFTISSLGGIGGTAFTPIVNAPEVAILGVVRSKMAPVWNGKEFAPRLMLPLCLSYDHRVIDGALAARFSRQLAGVLEDIRRLVV